MAPLSQVAILAPSPPAFFFMRLLLPIGPAVPFCLASCSLLFSSCIHLHLRGLRFCAFTLCLQQSMPFAARYTLCVHSSPCWPQNSLPSLYCCASRTIPDSLEFMCAFFGHVWLQILGLIFSFPWTWFLPIRWMMSCAWGTAPNVHRLRCPFSMIVIFSPHPWIFRRPRIFNLRPEEGVRMLEENHMHHVLSAHHWSPRSQPLTRFEVPIGRSLKCLFSLHRNV